MCLVNLVSYQEVVLSLHQVYASCGVNAIPGPKLLGQVGLVHVKAQNCFVKVHKMKSLRSVVVFLY